jgi:hypothetical protein
MLCSYLKQFRLTAIYLLISGLIFAGVFALLQLPAVPVLYALGLCAFLGLIFLLPDYLSFRRRHKLLSELDLRDSLEHLPKALGPLEEDYQALLRQLFQEKERLNAASQQSYQDMLEYYTLWVHQIKTPISAIDLILQAEDGLAFGEIKSELFKIQQYVEMVLGYLRLGSQTTDFVFCTYDLDKIIRTAVHSYAGQFIRQHVRLNYTPIHVQVLTDEKWLEFVLEQLLSNALKYTPGGIVTISLEDTHTLVIEDNGIGIAPEDLPRIFEKGYTGLNGRTNRRTTGIGLYLCHEIMEKLGHDISIQSELGQGTAVRLNLDRKSLEFDKK